MDDEVLMGELNSLANTNEKLDALWNRELLLIAEGVDRHAVHILHGQIQIAILRDAAIEKARYIRMLKAGEDLALLAKSLTEDVSRERQVNQLDGDLFLEMAIGTMRQIDGSHSAAAQQTIDLVRADATRFGSGFRVRAQG